MKIVHKLATAAPEIRKTDDTKKTYVFVASDESVDRHGDTVSSKGWELKGFDANPVILLNHDRMALPVGKATRTWVENAKLYIEVEFADAGGNPMGPQVERLVEGGFIRAVSVGFKALEYAAAKDRKGDGWFEPVDYSKQELLEVSIVTVPANANALLDSKNEAALAKEFALKTLVAITGPGRWVSEAELQAARVAKSAEAPEPVAPPLEPNAEQAAELVRSAVSAFTKALEMQRTGKL